MGSSQWACCARLASPMRQLGLGVLRASAMDSSVAVGPLPRILRAFSTAGSRNRARAPAPKRVVQKLEDPCRARAFRARVIWKSVEILVPKSGTESVPQIGATMALSLTKAYVCVKSGSGTGNAKRPRFRYQKLERRAQNSGTSTQISGRGWQCLRDPRSKLLP